VGHESVAIFIHYLALSRQLPWNASRNSYAIYQNGAISIILSDP